MGPRSYRRVFDTSIGFCGKNKIRQFVAGKPHLTHLRIRTQRDPEPFGSRCAEKLRTKEHIREESASALTIGNVISNLKVLLCP